MTKRKYVGFSGAFASSVALVLLVLSAPLPSALKLLVIAGVALGWTAAASRWAVRRFGRKAIVVIVIVPLVPLGLIGRAWWLDRPNQLLLARIDELPGISAATNGTFFVGKVDHVYIGPRAADADVQRFTELDGLDGMKILLVDRARISDDTARRLGRFTSLRYLTFQGITVSDAVLAELEQVLPHCQVEAIEAR